MTSTVRALIAQPSAFGVGVPAEEVGDAVTGAGAVVDTYQSTELKTLIIALDMGCGMHVS